MPTQQETIIKKLYEILEERPNGIRYSELVNKINEELPEVKINTIHGNVWSFKQRIDKHEIENVIRPEKGLYILKKYFKEGEIKEEIRREIREEDFYKPFAEYLINDLEECTKAIPLGRNKFGDKWGTPDVFGIYKFSETNPIRPLIEVVSAEMKTDTNQLITAFGQACSYKLFSHKVYLVVPKEAERDISRIESLCSRFGIGLILFDRNNSENPSFEIRTRAIKSEPDYFYVNEYLKKLGDDSGSLF